MAIFISRPVTAANRNDQGPGHIEPGGNAQNTTTLLGKMLRIHIERGAGHLLHSAGQSLLRIGHRQAGNLLSGCAIRFGTVLIASSGRCSSAMSVRIHAKKSTCSSCERSRRRRKLRLASARRLDPESGLPQRSATARCSRSRPTTIRTPSARRSSAAMYIAGTRSGTCAAFMSSRITSDRHRRLHRSNLHSQFRWDDRFEFPRHYRRPLSNPSGKFRTAQSVVVRRRRKR